MKVWPIVVGIVALCAGFGGAQLRRSIEIGRPPETIVVAPNDKLLASTKNVPNSNEGDLFYELLTALKQNYVEPVDDEQKLAVGAVRGMVTSLSDPNVQFLNEKQMLALDRAMKGEFEGIGVELKLVYDPEQLKQFRAAQEKLAEWNENGRKEVDGKQEELPALEAGGLIPDLVVSAVYPDSPAQRAGLKPGDQIDGVDGKWMVGRREVKELNSAFEKMRLGPTERETYLKMRENYIKRSDNSIAPGRVKERLTSGESGSVKLIWKAGGAEKSAMITKAVTKVAPLTGDRLMFVEGVDQVLRRAVNDHRTVFDLRGSGMGSFASMRESLQWVLPPGQFGKLVKHDSSGAPEHGGSASREPLLTLRVDSTTTGAARYFASLLHAAGKAELEGDLGPEPILEFTTMVIQGGSGYVLPTGEFKEVAN